MTGKSLPILHFTSPHMGTLCIIIENPNRGADHESLALPCLALPCLALPCLALLRFVFILFTAFAAGCVTYKEPTEGPTASIRFVGEAEVYTFDINSNYCTSNMELVTSVGTAFGSGTRKKIGLPLGEGLDDLYISEVKIPASKPFHFAMAKGSYGTYISTRCEVKMRLDPAPGKIYEARYEWKGQSCRIEVDEIRQNLSGHERTPDRSARKLPDCIRK